MVYVKHRPRIATVESMLLRGAVVGSGVLLYIPTEFPQWDGGPYT